ncbi:PEGA domain-containing protein [Sorangium atrum]|uniref:PEGA domain-containing protein n=1 Tax=Sorangium atrum TaxID=2995308 RepID=A0ABT5CD82_9BACT|nr:PEGA domain-containing protein [Sorangium aterium]MDC0684357.1 PEGA domain-containing protein [Sorangium aterium]
MTEQARKLFKEGVAAFEQSRWAEARAAFLAALALNGHYTIRGNLAAAELKLGRYRDATEHLARCVREMAEDATSTAEERARGEAAYAEARAKVGTLVVRTKVDGARVFVDGTLRGLTPLADPLFVEPGAHTISVEHEDYETKKMTVQLVAGGQIENGVELRQRSAGAPPPKRLDTTMAPLARGAEEHARDPRTALLIGGAATAGAAVVAGVVFTVLANANASDAEEQRSLLHQEGGLDACKAPGAPPRCTELKDAVAARYDFSNAAFWSFVGAGTVGVGTLVYGLISRSPVNERRVHVAPLVGSNGLGIGVRGGF